MRILTLDFGGVHEMNFELGEINIISTNIEKSLNFYRDILGFEVTEKEGEAVHLRGAGHIFLILPFAKTDVNSEKYCEKSQVSFDLYLEDVESAYNYFKEKNIRIEQDLNKSKDCFFIRDPDGLVIEIMRKDI